LQRRKVVRVHFDKKLEEFSRFDCGTAGNTKMLSAPRAPPDCESFRDIELYRER